MRILVFFTCLLVSNISSVLAQEANIFLGFSSKDEARFMGSVIDIGNFMHRFNMEEHSTGKPIELGHLTRRERQELKRNMVLSLIDQKAYFQALPASQKAIEGFVAFASQKSDSLNLTLYDSLWYAKLKVSVVYNNQPQTAYLTLKLEEGRRGIGYRWAICGVQAPFIDTVRSYQPMLSRTIEDTVASITPSSYGRSFMEVKDALNQPLLARQHISSSILEKGVEYYPELEQVILAFEHKQLQIKSIEEISFHLLQIPGWSIVVNDRSDNEGYSSGWLITQVDSLENRAQYLNQVLYTKSVD